MMLFGIDRHGPANRDESLEKSLRAGLLALRWWRRREEAGSARTAEEREDRPNPIHGWQ